MLRQTINTNGLLDLQNALDNAINVYSDVTDYARYGFIDLIDPDYEMIDNLETYANKIATIRNDLELASLLIDQFNKYDWADFKPNPDDVKNILQNNWHYSVDDEQAERIADYYQRYFEQI